MILPANLVIKRINTTSSRKKAMTVALTGFGETVTNVRGSQRPNSNLVDIYYDLNATEGGTYTVEFSIEGRTNEVTATTFSGDVDKGIAPGKNRHIVWEAGADWRGKKGDVKAVVTATVEVPKGKPKKVQLWAGGPYWADRNIGANNPWDYGSYFWWGDTIGSSTDFQFSWEDQQTTALPMSELQSEGWISASGILRQGHDAAHVRWGGWRMPTKQDFASLNNKCDWVWTTINGIKGCVVRGRGAYASNSIFLPAAGFGDGVSRSNDGSDGLYWSSEVSPNTEYACDLSWYLCFDRYRHVVEHENGYRYYKYSVRPVQGLSK